MTNSPARSSVDVGSVIAGTYIIEALIGKGGMGSVFLASHNRLPGKRVAIKMLHVELSSDEVIARFRREAMITSQLDHPNIVRVDDFNVHADGTPYLVLEYLEGESLASRLRHGPMPIEQVQSLARMIGSAISAAHQAGFIHRDLKPQNIFLVPTDLGGHLVDVAKVLDFGISKMLNSETVKTQESTLLGTPQYMAPEQATGQHGAIDERTDVFALGAIVYEMLTGTPAFSGENIPAIVFRVVYDQPPPLSQVAPSTPPSVIAAVERALQKRPSDRWPDVNAFIEALTGRALAQRSSSVAATPSVRTGSTASKRIDHGAFANTVDSGSVARPAAKPPRDGIAQAATVASRDGRGPATPSKRRGLLIAMTIAAIAAIVVFTRDAQLPAPADTARARVEADAAIPDALPDAAVAIVDAAPDAAPTKPPPDAKRPTPPTANRNEGDPAVWATLDKAQAEYKNGNYQAAIVHCNSVENASTASPVQHSIALLLRGTIHCKHENNIGLARADLRAIPVAAYRGQLLARCPDLR